jgi:GWxTD domain-containing protein
MKPIWKRGERRRRLAFGLLFLALALSASCRTYNLERKLPPKYADFISKVRYIISGKEEKTFLKLPDSEKDKFIEDFWARRDPYPNSGENEFKKQYFDRIDQANKLFLSEGKPGWLTDRGRIYILFGPPMERITNPLGAGSMRCSEVWYYGSFPVVFNDQMCTGSFELVTYDLTALREVNLAYMHELSAAQAQAQAEAQPYKNLSPVRDIFNFTLTVKSKISEAGRIEAIITIAIPYSGIWFKEEAGILKTEIEVFLELHDQGGRAVWEHKDKIEIGLKAEELKEKKNASYSFEVPFVLDENIELLRQGTNSLECRLKNLTGNEELRKVVEVAF